MNTFGENLKQARASKGFSQGELAEKTGIHAAHISRYERNLTIPSVDVVKKFADALEVSADVLVYGSGDQKAERNLEDTELLVMFKKTQLLNASERECIKTLLKAFLFQKEMQRQLV